VACKVAETWAEEPTADKHELMPFLRKKRVKFGVSLIVDRLTDVPLLNAVIFAKVHLVDGGSFTDSTDHISVRSHVVDFQELDRDRESRGDERRMPFKFVCQIPYEQQSGELEECRCKISIRKEDKAGRTPQKLGFVTLNLSEFAASGSMAIKQSYLLDGYSGTQRQDNSRLHVEVTMTHQGTDPVFKVPNSAVGAMEEAILNPADRKAPSATPCASAGLDENQKTNGEVPPTAKERPSSAVNAPVGAAPVPAERSSWHGGTNPPSLESVVERRFPSSGVTSSTALRRMSDDRLSAATNRVQRTRRDAEDVIEEVLAETGVDKPSEDEDRTGLALYVSKSGDATILGQDSSSLTATSTFERVNVNDSALIS
ncbi:Synthetic lethal with mec protein 3, partial [Aphelenchoides avenae]